MQITGVNQQTGNSLASGTFAITAVISGSSFTLGGQGRSLDVSGQFDSGGLEINVPVSGQFQTLQMTPGTVADYNADVANLQNSLSG
jgi:hypothetical protein